MRLNHPGHFDNCPIIAAIKDDEGLSRCMDCECSVVFVLFGTVCSIGEIVQRIKSAGKTAVVHIDLIAGLSAKEVAVDFIKGQTQADGIISTRPALIRRAKELSLIAIQRLFLLDSLALESITRQLEQSSPDFIEILPGVMPKVIARLCAYIKTPVIAGGLISDKEDVMAALRGGAVAVSTTNHDVWFL